VSFAYLSTPVISFSIQKAGDFIDASAATVMSERSNRVRIRCTRCSPSTMTT
jgi:hypothetical protein